VRFIFLENMKEFLSSFSFFLDFFNLNGLNGKDTFFLEEKMHIMR